ncbi:hypothetical protein E1B28_001887 [Marasmius oreades]|uniref:Bulb-type lectin domain-containing protein n=1 Tax=Marasmius oreades TaxID=181124 RepID=A0A9P8AFW0_9AGAR|nr:uncharacterized protein E1B28_001887 [Marasmius oreades]KAG7100107.1 hypothetical protein E1B28_001887 [Marasmius oreades]
MSGYVAPYGNTLPEHGVIGRGYALISTSGRVEFRVTDEGNLQLIANGKILWCRDGKSASWVTMQSDGNCCGYRSDGTAMWATLTNGCNHPYNLVCQDDGNLVVYAKGNRPVWATDTCGLVPPSPSFVHPYGSTLPEHGIIGRGYSLISDNKRVEFKVDYNGDLLLLGDGNELWSFKGKHTSYVAMQGDGNCFGYTSNGTAMFATDTWGECHPCKLVCQDDGNLVVYANGEPVWATNTHGLVRYVRYAK